MYSRAPSRRSLAIVFASCLATALASCSGSKEPEPAASSPTVPASPPAAPVAAAPAVATNVQPATPASWSPEALEDLLAPIALYPDPVLSQVLIASTNPQEVLDAGNWLVANESLKGTALDDAAAKLGFTPPVLALLRFPQTVDMMCMEMGWTTELGQAFVADQAGVLDAIQRLRKQAKDVGNLQTSEAMKVETEVQDGNEVIVLKPPKPDVVYVPTYDPQVAYAPAPAAAPVAATAPAATTSTTTTTTESGHSTGTLVTTGLLAFGAGILVNEVFDDDDNYPHYGYGGMPYYPPYPYRPPYGGGYYPSNGYQRPPNYNNGWQNNGTIIVNNPGGGGNGGGYWDRYDNPRAGSTSASRQQPRSPITAAKPNRPELNELNKRQPRPMPADAQRPSTSATASNWKGQSTYSGKSKPPAGVQRDASTRVAAANPKSSGNAGNRASPSKYPAPKVQGSYAGGQRPAGNVAKRSSASTGSAQRPTGAASAGTRDTTRPSTTSRPAPSGGGGDRGYGASGAPRPTAQPAAPSSRPAAQSANRGTAMSSGGSGSAERAASQRGRQSMPQGAHSKGGGNRRAR
jgi:Protein of unknown function (DUF3300)